VKYFEENPHPGLPDRDLKWVQQTVSIDRYINNHSLQPAIIVIKRTS
jgi:hypothetical protein